MLPASESQATTPKYLRHYALDILQGFQAGEIRHMVVKAATDGNNASEMGGGLYRAARQRMIEVLSILSPSATEVDDEAHVYLDSKALLEAMSSTGLVAEANLMRGDTSEEGYERLREAHFEASKLFSLSTQKISAQQRESLDKMIAGAALDLPLRLYIRFAEIGRLVDKLFDKEMIDSLHQKTAYFMWPAAIFVISCYVILLAFGQDDSANRISGAGIYGLLTGAVLALGFDSYRRGKVRKALRHLGAETNLTLEDMRPSRVYAVMQSLADYLRRMGLDIEGMPLEDVRALRAEIEAHVESHGRSYDLALPDGFSRMRELAENAA